MIVEQEHVDGHESAADLIGDEFLYPGGPSEPGDAAQHAKAEHHGQDKPECDIGAPSIQDPGGEDEQEDDELAHGEEGEAGAFVAPSCDDGQEDDGGDAAQGNDADDEADAFFPEAEQVGEDDDDGPDEDEVGVDAEQSVAGVGPRQAAHLLGVGEGGFHRRGIDTRCGGGTPVLRRVVVRGRTADRYWVTDAPE